MAVRLGDLYFDTPADADVDAELPQPTAVSRTFFLTSEGQASTPHERESDPGTGARLEVAFIDKCRIVRECIGRVRVVRERQRGWATGFLVAPGLLMTNHHVLPDVESAQNSYVEFGYWYDLAGQLSVGESISLSPMDFYVSDVALDYAVVAVEPTTMSRGYLRLIPESGKIRSG